MECAIQKCAICLASKSPRFRVFDLPNITLSNLTLVHYLPGHGLQSGSVLHKIFDHAAHPSDLLFCTVRYISLSYPISH